MVEFNFSSEVFLQILLQVLKIDILHLIPAIILFFELKLTVKVLVIEELKVGALELFLHRRSSEFLSLCLPKSNEIVQIIFV